MNDLDNCPRCGKLFVKGIRPICQSCFKEREEKFQTVYTYIRKKKNRKATMLEVSNETGVAETDIIQFIKEGRLHLHHLPNMAYPCESCGREIQEGRICDTCSQGIQSTLKREEIEKERKRRLNEREKQKNKTYHSLQDRLK